MCFTDCGVKKQSIKLGKHNIICNIDTWWSIFNSNNFIASSSNQRYAIVAGMTAIWVTNGKLTKVTRPTPNSTILLYICLLSIRPSFCLSLSPTPSAEISSTENRAEVHSLNLNPRLWNHSWRHCCHIAKDHSFLWQNLTNSARRLGNSAVQISGYTDETPRLD